MRQSGSSEVLNSGLGQHGVWTLDRDSLRAGSITGGLRFRICETLVLVEGEFGIDHRRRRMEQQLGWGDF